MPDTESDKSNSPDIPDLLKNPPSDWVNPKVRVTHAVLLQKGVLPGIISNNPRLLDLLTDFFVGHSRVLVVGGESGMGKSLLVSDLRLLNKDLTRVLPADIVPNFSVVSWDRTHQVFFDQVSDELETTIELPQGETHIKGREKVSQTMSDAVRFAAKYLGPNPRIVVEAPLIDTRGETIFNELSDLRDVMQTVIMHSPESRDETLKKGRLMKTSGQPDSMNAIREKLLWKILGDANKKLSVDEQDQVIKNWWLQVVTGLNGMVVEWSPNDDRAGYEHTLRAFTDLEIKPDVLSPRPLSKFMRRQYVSIFETLPDLDSFLKEVTPK